MSTEQAALELKQQGAIEAAQDPNSSVTSDDAQKKMVEESKNAGVAAYSFDPDASPEEKKRQIRAVSFRSGNSVTSCSTLSSLLTCLDPGGTR